MSTDKAKRIKILDVLDGYSNLIGKDLTGLTNSLCAVANDYPLDVVTGACKRLRRTCRFPPTPADMSEACEHFNAMLHPRVVQLHNGLISMDFGHGRIDMSGLTDDEQDVIIRNNGKMPDGRNAAFLTLDEKVAALKPDALPAPERIPVPRLRTFK